MKRAERPSIRQRQPAWGTPVEQERRRRIMVAVAAYAYEIMDDPIWSDAKYDRECLRINLKQPTGHPDLDRWFRKNFKPHTGIWVHDHPNRKGLRRIAKRLLAWRKTK